MKKFRLLLVVAFAALSFSAEAQVDYNDPQWAPWGETAEARQANMLNATFLKEAIDNKEFDAATKYLNLLIQDAPSATHNIYARGILLYRNKVNRARSLSEKNMYIDSIMLLHDMRLQYFASHPTYGADAILDSKARMYATYCPKDREGLRSVFREAIATSGQATKPDLVCIYFQNLCDDFQMDEIMADEVLNEYERLVPYFEALGDDAIEFKDKFEAMFGQSGAASCENLEALFAGKLSAAPDDVDLYSKAVALMERAGDCSSTPFYAFAAERLYELRPTAQAAMSLASVFQNQADYDKASKYLNDALEAEESDEAREALLSRISLVKFAADDISEALRAANAAIAINNENGVALFVKSQCYARSISGREFTALAAYWAAADVMQSALNSFTAEEEAYVAPATAMLSNYRAMFPSQEECFFNEVGDENSPYTVRHGLASGVTTRVRFRK